jgi:hypothetical protein
LCQNSTAPTLPLTSTNALPVHGHCYYQYCNCRYHILIHFTPAAGQCALPFTMSIVITTQITPTFTQIGPLCQNSTAPTLPLTSTNGITGTWSPATISTATAGTHYLYIYTSCRSVCSAIYHEYCDHYADNTNVYANRSAVSEQYCTTLPLTSTNGITVHGHLLLSVLQLPVPLLIHLHQLPVSVLCHLP